MENGTGFVTKEEIKKEALERLESLNLHPNVVKDFKEGVLNLSEQVRISAKKKRPVGVLYWIDQYEDKKRLVEKFEERTGGMVYHAILTPGMLALLYVSKYKEEWEMDREDLANGTPLVYVCALSNEWVSEFGRIGIESSGGGLIRTC